MPHRYIRLRSLYALVLLSFLLVALPLAVSVVRAFTFVDRLADESEALVVTGVQATRDSEVIAEEIVAMERNARQYQVLRDQELLPLYGEKQRRFEDALDGLESQQLGETVQREIDSMRIESRRISEALATITEQDTGAAAPAEFGLFRSLSESSAVVARDSSRIIDENLEQLQARTRKIKRALTWQSAALVPITLFLVALFTTLIVRPIRQVAGAVRRIGDGQFSEPVSVSGTADIEELSDQLDWMRVKLMEAAEEKNRFLRHMSHELKTPLANIREGTELLVDGAVGDLSENQREVATILRQNGIKLQQHIENLLNFSAWQAQEATLNLSRFNLGTLIERAIEQHRLTANARHLTIRYSNRDITVRADREKIRMVLDNLLSNAVKFSPDDGVITVTANRKGDMARLEVIDEGPGITGAQKDRVFEAFFQGDAQEGGYVRGTGIGLSVIRECVQAHGGEVELVDGDGKGAHFRVTIPIEPARQAA